MVDIKSEPELQHVLAHMLRAIQFCAEGELEAALYECESIESMVTFDGDDDFVKSVRQRYGVSRQEEKGQSQAEEAD